MGQVVADDLKQLVLLRNEAARKLGFKDYHVMRLYLSEQDQEQGPEAVRRAATR